MKQGFALLLLGLLALIVQGVVAPVMPTHLVPDLGLLVVLSIGLCWRPAVGGLLIAGALGYATDVLSGSLLGEHALLRVAVFGLARLANRQINLNGALPLIIFAAGVSIANGMALAGLTVLFGDQAQHGSFWLSGLGRHAIANAVCAPLIFALVERSVAFLSGEDSARNVVRLALGKPSA